MREILFRGKHTKTGEWVEGLLLTENNDTFYIVKPKTDVDDIGWLDYVKPETVGQYTGLTDRNGKKIFEGDIVKYREEYGYIEYADQEAMFNICFDTWFTDFDHIYGKEIEIIGNIRDNPELLEGNQ